MKSRNYFKLFLLFQLFVFISVSNGTTISVAVSNFQFTPSNVQAHIGDTIKWNWVDGSHTTSCDGILPGTSLPQGAASWNVNINSGAQTYSYVITVAGTYNYICIPHAPDMAGVIQVSGGSSSLLDENFNYPVGDSLGAHGWVSFSGGSTNTLMVTSPGLIYSGYPLSNIGNATKVLANGQDAYKNFSAADSTGTMYASFMINVASAQTGDYFFAFLPPTSTTLYTSRFYAKDSTGGLAFGISKSTLAAGGIFYTGGVYNYNTTYLIVIKYKFNPGTTTDDEMSFFVFSSGIPSTEPGTPTIGPITGTANDNTLGRIALRQGGTASSPVANVDGFRVAKAWSDIVTGIFSNNVTQNIPDAFKLYQNYPNPFNPVTTIDFSMTKNGFVDLTVFNSLGKEVDKLISTNLAAGNYSLKFNGDNLGSGIYFYKMYFRDNDGNAFSDTKRLILLK